MIERMFVRTLRRSAVANRAEQAALLALVHTGVAPWHRVADAVESAGSATGILSGELSGLEPVDTVLVGELSQAVREEDTERWMSALDPVLAVGDIQLLTILDDDYPANLREIYNRPPFIFVRGELRNQDEHSVAVVGTRRASAEGRQQARLLARALAEAGVTVISGLAAGIDTEAHKGALEVGGRTVAVMGTGIDRIYPKENVELAERIAGTGALISQFTPGMGPRKENFPIRNVVTSGMAFGTVVVEASGKSGARMQARLALEHGKRLFLVESLVLQEDWAREYASRPGAVVIKHVSEVLELLDARPARVEQLHLA